jgi:hypothetical protein
MLVDPAVIRSRARVGRTVHGFNPATSIKRLA